MLKLIAISTALFLSACLDEAGPITTDSTESDTVELARDIPGDKADDIEEDGERNICDLLPAEGACADACDPEAMLARIPAGSCVVFRCKLTDGTFHNTGGCNY